MKLRGLLIASVVLAAFLGVLHWSNHHRSTTDSSVKAASESAPRILTFDQLDARKLAIHHKDEPVLDLLRNDTGVWQITSPQPLTGDPESVSGVLSTLSSLTAERLLDNKASNLSAYGLATPSIEVDVTLKDNKTQRVLIGDQTPSGNAYYAMLADDPRLFTVASYNKTSLDKSANDLRDKRLITADFDKVSRVELIIQKSGKKQDITFERNKDAWQILKPTPLRTESYQVDELIRSLKDARMNIASTSAFDEAEDATAFRSAAPFAIAKITGASGRQQLELRKVKDEYYAKSTMVPGVYRVAASVGTSLDKSLDSFRNRKLFDFGYEDPNKIEIHDGSKSYFLTRSGSDWWSPDGKKLDVSTVDALLGNIRELAATRFAESGFGIPAVELTVISKDSKRSERVSIAKHGNEYMAKRDDEQELYELTASSIEQLQSLAENLKPAPTPKK